jgi:molecular chaperone DnaJ
VDVPGKSAGNKASRQSVSKKVTLKIPRGVEDGVTLRVTGQGGEGEKGAPNGSLFVDLKVAPDSYFNRDGLNINVVVPITITQVNAIPMIDWPETTLAVKRLALIKSRLIILT